MRLRRKLQLVTCGLVAEQRTHHQINGERMEFLTLADWTGMVETELFAQTYKSHGLATVRYPVLEITASVEPFENGRGFSLRVLRARLAGVSGCPPPLAMAHFSASRSRGFPPRVAAIGVR